MNPPPADHTKFIVSWIGIITLAALAAGAFLVIVGYSGELVFSIAVGGSSALATMVAMRRSAQPPVPPSEPLPPAP